MKKITTITLSFLLFLFIGNMFAQSAGKFPQKKINDFSAPKQKQIENNSLSVRTNTSSTSGQVSKFTLTVDPQYLIFQLFTYGPLYGQPIAPFNSTAIRQQIDEILAAVDNNRGDGISGN